MTKSKNALPDGYRLAHFDEVASTNSAALELVRGGDLGPVWVVADRQSHGRGRNSRPWTSIPGNLHASVLVQTACPAACLPELGFVAGVACLDAARSALSDAATKVNLALKWPNDLLLDGRKCAGILVEKAPDEMDFGNSVVIGFGVNIIGHPPDTAFPACHLGSARPGLERWRLFAALTSAFDQRYRSWADGAGFAGICQAWMSNAHGLGKEIRLDVGGQIVSGRFAGLDRHGGLRLATSSGEEQVVLAGDYLGMVEG